MKTKEKPLTSLSPEGHLIVSQMTDTLARRNGILMRIEFKCKKFRVASPDVSWVDKKRLRRDA